MEFENSALEQELPEARVCYIIKLWTSQDMLLAGTPLLVIKHGRGW